MSRNSCKGCEYSQKCELVKMTKEERKRREEIEEAEIITGDTKEEFLTEEEIKMAENIKTLREAGIDEQMSLF